MSESITKYVPEAIAFKHGFSGSWAPARETASYNTFSVGVFQWLPKSSGQGLKKSAVVIRVKGSVSMAESVFAKAAEICARLDAGESFSQKSFSV